MTELTFLLELLLNHKLPKGTKAAIAGRIKEVEEGLSTKQIFSAHHQVTQAPVKTSPPPAAMANQSPSMQAIMARNPDLMASLEESSPPPVTVIAQTPAAQAALAAREQIIAMAVSGKPEPGQTSPRKFHT